jgi:transcriptional regulator with XRE-family HTH domain
VRDPSARLGAYLREQRSLSQLSLREMARLADISNAYLSQIERGLHVPSLRVLRALADALGMPVEDLVHLDRAEKKQEPRETSTTSDVESAIKRDPRLTEAHKQALLVIYRSCVESGGASQSRA